MLHQLILSHIFRLSVAAGGGSRDEEREEGGVVYCPIIFIDNFRKVLSPWLALFSNVIKCSFLCEYV